MKLEMIDLGRCQYRQVLKMQFELHAQRCKDLISDTLILVEHEPVYTLGRSADEGNILLSSKVLEEKHIDVVKIGRGGDVTFHGPGQIVGYPIINLRDQKLGVVDLVDGIEKTLTAVLAGFGIRAGTDRGRRGVWVGDEKIAAIGLRISHGVSMHGFALNVSPDLNYYKGIIPCGIKDKAVTSMEKFMHGVNMDMVKKPLVESFCRQFGYTISD